MKSPINAVTKQVSRTVNNVDSAISKNMKRPVVVNTVRAVLIGYSVFVGNMPNWLLSMYDNFLFRLAIASLIVYFVFVDPVTALLMSAAFIFSVQENNYRKAVAPAQQEQVVPQVVLPQEVVSQEQVVPQVVLPQEVVSQEQVVPQVVPQQQLNVVQPNDLEQIQQAPVNQVQQQVQHNLLNKKLNQEQQVHHNLLNKKLNQEQQVQQVPVQQQVTRPGLNIHAPDAVPFEFVHPASQTLTNNLNNNSAFTSEQQLRVAQTNIISGVDPDVGYKTLKGQLGSQGLNVPRGYDPEGSESSQF